MNTYKVKFYKGTSLTMESMNYTTNNKWVNFYNTVKSNAQDVMEEVLIASFKTKGVKSIIKVEEVKKS